MSRKTLVLFALILASTSHSVFSAAPTTAPATRPAAWGTKLEAAFRTAATAKRDSLVWFSGSGWNAASDAVEPAMKSDVFLKSVGGTFELARADFPDGQANTAEPDPQYTIWAEKLRVTSLPAIVAVDASGRPYGTVTVPAGDAAAVIAQVDTLLKAKAGRDAAFAEAQSAQGTARAAALAKGLTFVGPFARDYYSPMISELLALDPNDSLMLRAKYAPMLSEATIDKVVQNEIYPMLDKGHFAEVIARLDKLLAEAHPTLEQKQLLIGFKAQVAYSRGQQKQAVAWLDDAMALDPAGPAAARLKKAKDQILETPAPN